MRVEPVDRWRKTTLSVSLPSVFAWPSPWSVLHVSNSLTIKMNKFRYASWTTIWNDIYLQRVEMPMPTTMINRRWTVIPISTCPIERRTRSNICNWFKSFWHSKMELFFSLPGNDRRRRVRSPENSLFRWMGCGVGLVFTFLFWHLQDLGGSPTLFGKQITFEPQWIDEQWSSLRRGVGDQSYQWIVCLFLSSRIDSSLWSH